MPNTPRPEGWKGGSEDFTIVRTLDGHRTTSKYDINHIEQSADFEHNRNARTFAEADLGGEYDF